MVWGGSTLRFVGGWECARLPWITQKIKSKLFASAIWERLICLFGCNFFCDFFYSRLIWAIMRIL